MLIWKFESFATWESFTFDDLECRIGLRVCMVDFRVKEFDDIGISRG